MSLLTAILLFAASLAGVFAAMVFLRQKKVLRIVCMSLCILIAVILAAYIGLAVLFLEAIQNQPPAP